jgi:hypothetical protein
MVAFEDELPIAGAPLSFSLAAGPTLEIADGGIGIN